MTDPRPLGLDDMAVFTVVIEAGGFTAAARRLGLRKSTVSRRVRDLETRLGVQLLHRTTRQLRLTDLGEEYYQRCTRVVAEARAAEEALREGRASPRGTLRLSATPFFAELLLPPVISAYLTRHPDVSVELYTSWGLVDLLGQGFDLALRVGPLADSSLLSRALGTTRVAYCASTDYLRAHGMPRTPRDLGSHTCVLLSDNNLPMTWPFVGPRGRQAVPVSGRLRANSFAVALQAVLAGQGIGRFPYPFVARDVEAGRLIEVLSAYAPSTPMHAVYPGSRHGSPKVQAFLELLAAHLQVDMAWSGVAAGGTRATPRAASSGPGGRAGRSPRPARSS